MPMTRDPQPLVPAPCLLAKPPNLFGLMSMTTFIERLPVLTVPPTLAPLRVRFADAPFPRGSGASLSAEGTLSEGLVRVVTSPHLLLECS
jgi:hypothetical protein